MADSLAGNDVGSLAYLTCAVASFFKPIDPNFILSCPLEVSANSSRHCHHLWSPARYGLTQVPHISCQSSASHTVELTTQPVPNSQCDYGFHNGNTEIEEWESMVFVMLLLDRIWQSGHGFSTSIIAEVTGAANEAAFCRFPVFGLLSVA